MTAFGRVELQLLFSIQPFKDSQTSFTLNAQTSWKYLSTTTKSLDVYRSLETNVGVFTDPQHNLFVEECSPSLKDLEAADVLKEGEVLIEMKATGICGYVALSFVT